MVTVPDNTPVIIPVNDPAVAIDGLPLLHTPPPIESVSVVEAPVHTAAIPVITDGLGFTVTGAVVIQLPGNPYVIMDIPLATPVTIPVVLPAVAIPGMLELQVPLPRGSVSAVLLPGQIWFTPVIGPNES